jgi:hypothetical protein
MTPTVFLHIAGTIMNSAVDAQKPTHRIESQTDHQNYVLVSRSEVMSDNYSATHEIDTPDLCRLDTSQTDNSRYPKQSENRDDVHGPTDHDTSIQEPVIQSTELRGDQLY